jgi:hypothetical protein
MIALRLGDGCISSTMELAAHRAMTVTGMRREDIDFETNFSA